LTNFSFRSNNKSKRRGKQREAFFMKYRVEVLISEVETSLDHHVGGPGYSTVGYVEVEAIDAASARVRAVVKAQSEGWNGRVLGEPVLLHKYLVRTGKLVDDPHDMPIGPWAYDWLEDIEVEAVDSTSAVSMAWAQMKNGGRIIGEPVLLE
jgi:hypothetical protein